MTEENIVNRVLILEKNSIYKKDWENKKTEFNFILIMIMIS